MALTVNDIRDLTQLLAQHPEWLAEVRRLVLTEELLALPELVRGLAEAGRRAEERLGRVEEQLSRLAEAQAQTEAQVRALIEAQAQTEAQVRALVEAQAQTEAQVRALIEAQAQTEAQVRALVEAQAQTETQVRALIEAQAQTEAQVRALIEAQARTETQVRALVEAQAQTETQVRALVEAQAQTETQVRALVEAQAQTEAQVQTLAETQQRYEGRLARVEERLADLNLTTQRLVDRVGYLQGQDLERRYRERAEAYMGRWLWPVRAVAPGSLREELEARLNETEVEDVMQVDVLLQGRGRWLAERPEVWLVMEVSAVIDQVDVERAERRAALLRQAGYRAVPAVAGERLTEGAEHRVREAPIVVVLDGRSQGWERVVQA